MNFCSDNRAQSIHVGAVLLFGLLVLALTLYQAQGVPEENKQVEFEHSQQVGDEMVDLYTAVFETVISGEPQTATITLGTSYNDRLFFIYPPPASGTLQTTPNETVRLHNVTAVTDTNQSFDNYWNNTTATYESQAITYEPNYRELRGAADYRIEYGMLAAEYDNSNITELRLAENHQPIIDGDEIELVVIDGELQSVDTNAESVIPERVTGSTELTVRNATNTSGITLELPTALSDDHWNTSDPEAALYGQENVESVSVNDGTATIRLDSSTQYSLTIHKVIVGSAATEPEPTYLQNVSYSGSELGFTIRDQFNDPVAEPVDVWVFNASGAVNETSTERESPENDRSVQLDGVDDPCGVALDDDIGATEPYERITVTGAC